MSRAFVKEDGDAAEKPPVLPVSQHPYFMTPGGVEQFRTRLENARASGNERDATDLEEKLDRAIVVDPAAQPKDTVHFGATVDVEEPAGQHTYTIVGEDEANPLQGTISWLSPLAQALENARVGQRVVWLRPAGNVPVRVKSIRYDS